MRAWFKQLNTHYGTRSWLKVCDCVERRRTIIAQRAMDTDVCGEERGSGCLENIAINAMIILGHLPIESLERIFGANYKVHLDATRNSSVDYYGYDFKTQINTTQEILRKAVANKDNDLLLRVLRNYTSLIDSQPTHDMYEIVKTMARIVVVIHNVENMFNADADVMRESIAQWLRQTNKGHLARHMAIKYETSDGVILQFYTMLSSAYAKSFIEWMLATVM